MGKEKMSAVARELGLNVPQTWLITDNSIPSEMTYPVITKAISSVEGSKDNIMVCRNENELRKFLNGQHCDVIQVQRFIDKEFEFQLMGCSLGKGDIVFIPGRTHIDRPNGMDNTFFLRFDKYESEFTETVDRAIQFVKKSKYTGPFSIYETEIANSTVKTTYICPEVYYLHVFFMENLVLENGYEI